MTRGAEPLGAFSVSLLEGSRTCPARSAVGSRLVRREGRRLGPGGFWKVLAASPALLFHTGSHQRWPTTTRSSRGMLHLWWPPTCLQLEPVSGRPCASPLNVSSLTPGNCSGRLPDCHLCPPPAETPDNGSSCHLGHSTSSSPSRASNPPH